MDLTEEGYESVDWIHLAQGSNQWRILVNMEITIRSQETESNMRMQKITKSRASCKTDTVIKSRRHRWDKQQAWGEKCIQNFGRKSQK
jgi:hypothetical protein